MQFLDCFRPMEKMGPDGPKLGQEDLFPTNPDLADILHITDVDFDNFFLIFWAPNLGRARARAGAQAWAQAWARAEARAWAHAWAQAPPAPAPPAPQATPDKFSDPNLTPLPTHSRTQGQGSNTSPGPSQQPFFHGAPQFE